MTSANPEIAGRIAAAGIATNLHDHGAGYPVLMLHGSGPGVSAWANWRLVMPELAKARRVIAPDLVGFGFTERPANVAYNMDTWGVILSVETSARYNEATCVGVMPL